MKHLFISSIRRQLLFLVLISVLPAIGIVIYTGLERRGHDIEWAGRDAEIILQSLSNDHRRAVDDTRRFLVVLSKLPEVQKKDARATTTLFRELLAENPMYANILATDEGGMVFASALSVGDRNLGERQYFKDAVATGEFTVGEYRIGAMSGRPVLPFAYPVRDGTGRIKGVVAAGLDLDNYGRYFVPVARLSKGMTLNLLDRNFVRLYRYPDREKYAGKTDLPEIVKHLSQSPGDSVFTAVGVDGVKRLFSCARFSLKEGLPPYLYMRVGIPEKDILLAARKPLVINIVLLSCAFLGALILAWWLGTIIILRRLNALVDASRKLGRGDLSVRTGIGRDGDELGQLARSFDDMAEALETKETHRQQAERQFRDQFRFLQNLLDTISNPVFYKDKEGLYRGCNKAFEAYIGLPKDKIVGRSVHDINPKELADTYHRMDRELIENPGVQTYDTLLRFADGSFHDVIFNKATYTDIDGNAEGIIGVIVDITDRKKAQEALQKSEQKFRTIFEDSRDAIYISTVDGTYVDVNEAYLELFGYRRDEIDGLNANDAYADATGRDRFRRIIGEKGSVRDYEVVLRKKDGRLMDCIMTATVRYDEERRVSGYQGIIRDITQKKKIEEQLRSLSIHDDLTGLHNRRGFFALARQQMKLAKRTGKSMILFFMDLDKMKWINDTLGHQEGDRALTDVGAVLSETFRELDIIGRMGGDEFAVLVLDAQDESGEKLLARLIANLERRNSAGGRRYALSLSVGSAHYDPVNPSSLDDLIALADERMYAKKREKQENDEKAGPG